MLLQRKRQEQTTKWLPDGSEKVSNPVGANNEMNTTVGGVDCRAESANWPGVPASTRQTSTR